MRGPRRCYAARMLQIHPDAGAVLKCDFSGFVEPEMHKGRWVVVVSPKDLPRPRLLTIVPLSTTAPDPVEKHHVKLKTVLPHNEGTDIEVWAKCDMVFSASFKRVNLWWRDKSVLGKRVYTPISISDEELAEIRKGILYSVGLGGLADQVKPPQPPTDNPSKLAV